MTSEIAIEPAGLAARGHSSATLSEAAVAESRARSGTDCGIDPQIAVDPAIRAAWPGATVAGPAYTVQGAGGDNLALHRAVAAAPPGHVLVADLGGAAHGHWGEVLAVAAQARRLAGLVIDGGVRDVHEMQALGFGVFSRNNTVRGTRKLFAGVLDAPISVGGVVVRTGDLVVGDSDGVVMLPRDRVGAVLDLADQRVHAERDIVAALRAGRTTLDLYGLA